MKAVQGRLTAVIDAPHDLMAQIAIMSLADNGYPPGLFNLLDEITTNRRKSQKASGIGYDLDISVKLSWQAQSGSRTKLWVSVVEREGHLTARDCERECFKIIKGVHDRCEGFVQMIAQTRQRTTYGDARWATTEDLAEADYLVDSIDSGQLLLGPYAGNKYVALPAEETERHALVCGPTGCGKTSTLFVPNLLERAEWSAIVSEATAGTVESKGAKESKESKGSNEAKESKEWRDSKDSKNLEEVPTDGPDLFRKTAGYRALKGHKIYYFNPDDLSSHRINPIQGITTIKQSSRLATLLIKNTSLRVDTTADPFWETAETALLTSLIMYAAGNKGNLGDVRNLLRAGPKGLASTVQNSVVAEARARYEEFVQWTTDATRNSIVIGLMQRLELWTQPTIVALTETNDVDFEELQNELFTFYLSVPADKPELKPCASIIFTYLLNFVAVKPLKHRLSLYLDEFTNFGFITDFPNKLSIIRHRHIPAMLGLQDYNQAEEIYKTTAATLFSQPATRIFFKPQTLAQAKIISESLGTENVYERSVSSNCQINEKEFGRDLMTPGAVQMLKKGRAIVFTPNTNPINLVRFEPGTYNEKSSIVPPPRRVLKVDDSLVRQCDQWRQEQRIAEEALRADIRSRLESQKVESPARGYQKGVGDCNKAGVNIHGGVGDHNRASTGNSGGVGDWDKAGVGYPGGVGDHNKAGTGNSGGVGEGAGNSAQSDKNPDVPKRGPVFNEHGDRIPRL